MAGEVAASCCCGGGGGSTPGVYYATACSTTGGCIPISCSGVSTIAFCDSYLAALGLSLPLDLSRCWMFRYGCCLYRITSHDASTLCPSGVTGVVNQGTFIRVFDPASGHGCCDTPMDDGPVIEPTCITAIWDSIDPDWKMNIGSAEGGLGTPCWMMVANDYQRVDQLGIVKGKEPKIVTTFTECVDNYGISDSERCDGCKPLRPVNNTITVTQPVGICDEPDSPAPCPVYRVITKTVANTLTCNDCIPCKCCGNDPCEGVDPNYPWCDDHFNTYQARALYSLYIPRDPANNVVPAKWFIRDVMTVTFEFDSSCTPPLTNDLVTAIGDPYSLSNLLLNDPWHGVAVGLTIANVDCIAYSSSVTDFANAITALFGGLVTASPIGGDYDSFWLGNRQTCTWCCGTYPPPSGCFEPNVLDQQPPRADGDFLIVTGYSIVDGKKVYTIAAASYQMAASAEHQMFCSDLSPPGFTCDWFKIPPTPPPYFRGITVASIGATGNTSADIQYWSMAEYYAGKRYTMRQIEESTILTTICTATNPAFSVPLKIGVTGFPVAEIPVPWIDTGAVCFDPTSKWVNYPWVFDITPCDPEVPGNVKCPLEGANEFQDPGVYCQTNATVPQIVSPSSP